MDEININNSKNVEERRIEDELKLPNNCSFYDRVKSWRWVPTSIKLMEEAERRILKGFF